MIIAVLVEWHNYYTFRLLHIFQMHYKSTVILDFKLDEYMGLKPTVTLFLFCK